MGARLGTRLSTGTPAAPWSRAGPACHGTTSHHPLEAKARLSIIITALVATRCDFIPQKGAGPPRPWSVASNRPSGFHRAVPTAAEGGGRGAGGSLALPSPRTAGARLARRARRLLHVPSAPGSSVSRCWELAKEGSHVLGSPTRAKGWRGTDREVAAPSRRASFPACPRLSPNLPVPLKGRAAA